MDLTKLLNLVPIIQIVGAKKQGKTKLIQQILPILRGKNKTIVTFKHSYHKHPIDKPGSDSDKFSRAGANISIFQSAEGTAFFSHQKISN